MKKTLLSGAMSSQRSASYPEAGSWRLRYGMVRAWFIRIIGILAVSAMLLFVVMTDSRPNVDPRPAPTAEQVASARAVVRLLRENGGATAKTKTTSLADGDFDALSALGSYALRPHRLDIFTFDTKLHIRVSYRLFSNRWLNLSAEVQAKQAAFPSVRLKAGAISFSPALSRVLIDASVTLARLVGIAIPPIDEVITAFRMDGNRVMVAIKLPSNSEAVNRIFEMQSRVEAAVVAGIYCRLAAEQTSDPQSDFAVQVRRAFTLDRADEASAEANQAAFIALAMLVVDRRAGAIAGVDPSSIERCASPQTGVLLHNRSDLPKHWALSAALAAGAGEQIAEAMGEYKELADSLSTKSEFEKGDATGFSFVDIAADRAGFLAAKAAGSAGDPAILAARLSEATAEDLLPAIFLLKEESLYSEFKRKFGGLDDPRYRQAVAEIDQVLHKDGVSKGIP